LNGVEVADRRNRRQDDPTFWAKKATSGPIALRSTRNDRQGLVEEGPAFHGGRVDGDRRAEGGVNDDRGFRVVERATESRGVVHGDAHTEAADGPRRAIALLPLCPALRATRFYSTGAKSFHLLLVAIGIRAPRAKKHVEHLQHGVVACSPLFGSWEGGNAVGTWGDRGAGRWGKDGV